jgi:hypothetical protein
MISIFYSTKDRYSRIGINHFIEKFGIPVLINEFSPSAFVISYGNIAHEKYVIHIAEQQIQKKICGTIHLSGRDIPVCQIPQETGLDGEVIAFFENGTTRYPCITRKKDGYFLGLDIFRETGHILSGHYDKIRDSLDTDRRQKLASEPIVDILENILFDGILSCCSDLNIPLVQKSYWPEGKPFAVCLTHDVDELKKTYQWISRPARYLIRRDLKGFIGQIRSFFQKAKGNEPYYTFEDIIRIESDLNAKSTYYILKETGDAQIFSRKTWYLYGRNRSLQTQEMRELIKRLLANGDEVAIHGSYFSYRKPELLEEETRELEGLINDTVVGTRQHNLNLEIPKTWEYQAKAGLKYDTSLGFKDTIGFRWGTSFPFYPVCEGGTTPILEIPLIIMDICLDSCENKEHECFQIADKVQKYHGVLTLLWHPPIFNTLEYPDARDIYIKINQHCRHNDAWITRGRDIYEWLTTRHRNTFSYSYDGKLCTIIPHSTDAVQFFTIIFPPEKECIILSENASIIKKEGDRIYLKTNNLKKEDKIVVRLNGD